MQVTASDPLDPDSYQLAVRIGAAWVKIRRGAGMSALRDYLFGVGEESLDQGQMDSLDLLAQRPTWRMSDLAEALRVDPSTATRAVQRLVAAGLATRGGACGDGRVVQVQISAAGSARHQEVHQRRAALMTHMLGAFSPAERPVLADMLERFTVAVDDFVAEVAPPVGDHATRP